MTVKATWLLFSDLHVGMSQQDYLLPRFRQNLLDDLKSILKKTGRVDAVIFSGDLTQTGSKAEFDKLDGFLDDIWSLFSASGNNPSLISVPGNHDLERPSADSPMVAALNAYFDNSVVKNAIWRSKDNEYQVFLRKIFQNYKQWQDVQIAKGRHLAPISSGTMVGDALYEFGGEGAKVAVLALNSTWLQLTGADYTAKLDVNARQLIDTIGDRPDMLLRNYDARILVTHQPTSWLHPSSLKIWESEIFTPDRFDIHVFGHMHEPILTSVAAGGADPRRSLQSPSMFGLEYLGDGAVERIHGYTAAQFQIGESGRVLQIWPRKTAKSANGTMRLAPDLSYELDDDLSTSQMLEGPTGKPQSAPQSAVKAGAPAPGAIAQIDDVDIGPLRYFIADSPAHFNVRRVEQRAFIEFLQSGRVCWLCGEWGMDGDGFLSAIMRPAFGKRIDAFRFDLEDYQTTSAFLDGIRERFGFSFQKLCDELPSDQQIFIIFDNVILPQGHEEGAIPFYLQLEEMAVSLLDYVPNAFIVFRTLRHPGGTKYGSVTLQSLDEADIAIYLTDSPKGQGLIFSSADISTLHRHTDGLPIRLNAALSHLEVGSLDDLVGSNSDITQNIVLSDAVPAALVSSISEIKDSKDLNLRRAHDLLLALATLPKGEQLARLKRFYGPHPIHVTHARELRDRSLVDSFVVNGMGQKEALGSNKILAVPRSVRDYIRSSLSIEIAKGLDDKAVNLYFGSDWRSGDIENSLTAKRTRDPLCNATEIANASILIARVLHRAVDEGNDRDVEAATRLASSYVSALTDGDHFRAVVSLCDDILPVIDADNFPSQANILRYQRAKGLRMVGRTEESIGEFLSVNLSLLSKQQRQSALTGLAMACESVKDDRATDFAKRSIAIDRHSIHAIQAQMVIAELLPDKMDKVKELRRLLAIAAKKKSAVLVNNIKLLLADLESIGESSSENINLREVLKSSVIDQDFYNGARAIVALARGRDRSKYFPDEDKSKLIEAYHFLYNERLGNLFNMCHAALWDIFEAEGDTDNLLNLFRHSSFIWRINGQDKREAEYLSKLVKSLHTFIGSGINNLNRDHTYFIVRVTVVLGEIRALP